MTAAVAASIVVGAAFLVAGGAKIAAGRHWPAQAAALGAPRIVVPIVPWWEIVVGALLVAQIDRDIVAWVAVITLVAFTVLIVARLASGQHPPCACFGSWSARPLGWRHVVRNFVLIALGVLAALG